MPKPKKGKRLGGSPRRFGLALGETDVEHNITPFFETQIAKPRAQPFDRGVIGGPRFIEHTDPVLALRLLRSCVCRQGDGRDSQRNQRGAA